MVTHPNSQENFQNIYVLLLMSLVNFYVNLLFNIDMYKAHYINKCNTVTIQLQGISFTRNIVLSHYHCDALILRCIFQGL